MLFWKRRPVLKVPPTFNRNSARVSALMPPEQSGRWLLERMQQHLGIADYADVAMLDFGCGVRFSQAILNLRLRIGAYVGVDCFGEMIRFLSSQVRDPRFTYVHQDLRHPLYNPLGSVELGPDTRLDLPHAHFDVICLFSVLTHQHPDHARHMLAMLRRHVRPAGRLFFTCFLDTGIGQFEDRSPERNGGMCFYNPRYLEELVRQAGWQSTARHLGEGPLIGDSYACAPEIPAADLGGDAA